LLPKPEGELANGIGRCPVRTRTGFTVLELAVVTAIASLLIGMGLMAFSNLKVSVKTKNLAGDLLSTLANAHGRATARQRTQIVVIDAIAGANGTFGFYHFEDAATAPNIFSATDLSAILGSLNPSQPSTAPNPYVLRVVDSTYDVNNSYLAATNAWGGTLPFPFTPVPVNTSGGCSFCSAGAGATAFLPNGRAIFSDGNTLGGLIMLQGTAPTGSTANKTGLAISPTGFFQKLVP
jgi:hypothetical protein